MKTRQASKKDIFTCIEHVAGPWKNRRFFCWRLYFDTDKCFEIKREIEYLQMELLKKYARENNLKTFWGGSMFEQNSACTSWHPKQEWTGGEESYKIRQLVKKYKRIRFHAPDGKTASIQGKKKMNCLEVWKACDKALTNIVNENEDKPVFISDITHMRGIDYQIHCEQPEWLKVVYYKAD